MRRAHATGAHAGGEIKPPGFGAFLAARGWLT